MATYFAIDTNVFLHYKLFTEIDWTTLLEGDDLRLLLTKTVIRELDDKKSHPEKTLSGKAKKALEKIDQCIDEDFFTTHKKSFPVEAVRSVVPADYYAPRDLSESVPDDRFLAEVLYYKDSHPEDTFVIVSWDTGMKLKTKWLGLLQFRMPDEYRQDTKDPRDKELESLRKEVLKHQSKAPRLKVRFKDGDQHLEVAVKRIERLTDAEIAQTVASERERFETELAHVSDPTEIVTVTNLTTLAQMVEPNLDKFKADWEQYLAALPGYLRAKNEYDRAVNAAIKVELELVNDGTAPAHAPGVHLNAPEHIRLVEEDDYKAPEEPERLRRPSLLNRLASSSFVTKLFEMGSIAAQLQETQMRPYPISPMVYAKVNGHYPPSWSAEDQEASIELRELKNRYNAKLPALYVVLEDGHEWEPFHLDVVIEAGLPDAFEHDLHIIVTPESGNPE